MRVFNRQGISDGKGIGYCVGENEANSEEVSSDPEKRVPLCVLQFHYRTSSHKRN
jgi:hypothetical protein